MGSNSVDQNNHHEAIEVFQLDRRRLDSLHQKLSTQPSLLSQSAGRVICSIFRVPQTFIDHNGQALYYPDVVSIGPFHRGKPHLQIIQERKYQYLAQLLSRTKVSLEDLFNSLQHLQEKARESYSETILLDAHDFVELMVVDGCFVLELFRKVAKLVRFANDDPIASMSWIFSFLLRDFLRLENQLPFFVLQRLFEVSRSEEERNGPSLQTLILTFFSYAVSKLDDVTEKIHNLEGEHLLDILRRAFTLPELGTRQRDLGQTRTPSHVIDSVAKLRFAGIKIRSIEADSFLTVKFRRGLIEMPTVTFDDFMSSFFANCMVYELCHKNSTTYFTSYFMLLDCLVNSQRDVQYLCDQNIIHNFFGTEAEIFAFISNLAKDVTLDIGSCYLAELFNDVNDYYQYSWHVQWARFKYAYISVAGASVLLVLTVLQALYGMLSYYKGN